MMEIGMMTSAFCKKTAGDRKTTYVEQIHYCKEAGFHTLDFNLCKMIDNETELNGTDWQEQTESIRNTAEKEGVTFYQSHPPFSHVPGGGCYEDKEKDAWFLEMEKRAIVMSSMLGIKWSVIHPMTVMGANALDAEANLKANHDRFDAIVDLAIKNNVGIAMENMRDNEDFRRFCVDPEELVTLVDSFQSPSVGICWDAGHGNQRLCDQRRALRLIGKRLHVTHINDNHGQSKDEHLIPYMGTIKWNELMPVFKEIGFNGPLVFELAVTDYMPMELKVETMKYAKKIGEYLIKMAG